MAYRNYSPDDRSRTGPFRQAREQDRWRSGAGSSENDHEVDREELGEGFERRGWRPGSDYYGDNPERYGAGNYDAGAFGAGRYADREYIGDRNASSQNWEDRTSGYGRDHGGRNAGGSYGQSFNDRWQDSYGSSASQTESFGTESGQFRGRGPKGYRRSDERIREDVCECLTEDDRIDASNIDVTVTECEVTLSGTVSSREEKRRAEDLIERLAGVKDVNNSLRVAGRTDQDDRQQHLE